MKIIKNNRTIMNSVNNIPFIYSALILVFFISFSIISCNNSSFKKWDQNADANLDEREFGAVLDSLSYMDRWDNNVDGIITSSEWRKGMDSLNIYRTDDYGMYEDWDTNSDDVLFEDELNKGLFITIDRNEDGVINKQEYDTWNDIGLK